MLMKIVVSMLALACTQSFAATRQVKELGSFATRAVVESTPGLLADGGVVVGSFDSYVYFIKPDQQRAGQWNVFPAKTRGPVSSSPLLMQDGNLAVGSSDGSVYLFDQNGKEIRSIALGGFIWSSPAQMRNGTLVVGSHDGFVAFFKADGTVIKKYQTQAGANGTSEVNSSPLILEDGGVAVGANDGRVYFFNSDLSLRGSVRTGNAVWSSPKQILVGADRGTVVVGSTDGNLYFIDPNTLRVKRQVRTGGDVTAAPLVTSMQRVVTGSFDGKVYILDSSGRSLGAVALPLRGAGTVPPIWAGAAEMPDGTVVVGGMDGYVYFIDPIAMRIVAEFKTGQAIFAPARVLSDSSVVIGSHDYKVYFLALETLPN